MLVLTVFHDNIRFRKGLDVYISSCYCVYYFHIAAVSTYDFGFSIRLLGSSQLALGLGLGPQIS